MDYTLGDQGLRERQEFTIEANRRENEGIFRTLFEKTNDPILILNCGRFIDCNDATLRLLGYTVKSELLEQSPSDISPLLQPDGRSSQEKAAEMIDVALRVGYHQFEWLHTRADGSCVPVEVTLTPVTIGGELILHTLWRDITERRKGEERLSYSVALTNAALESTADGILVVDLSGKIVRWNRKFVELWDIPEEMIAAHDDPPVLNHVLARMTRPADFLARVRELYQHPEDSSDDLLELTDGRLIERYSQPLRIGREIVGRFWSFRDSTESRKLEEAVRRHNRELEQRVKERTQSLEDVNCELLAINAELELRRNEAEETNKKLRQLSSAVENSSTSIVITDCLGQIEYVNPKFTEITGYLPHEVLGENPRILKADSQPTERYQELWETICSGREWSGDFCNRKKNGDIFWEHASISPIRGANGQITSYVAVKEDITEQKRIAGELLTAQEAALAANRAKSEFLANMSHEIRTPLSAIIGFSDLTLRTALQPRQQDYLQKIQTAGDLLLSIINDILDFSKIEARHLEMEQIPFRLDTILANVTDIVQQKVKQKGLGLRVETAPEVAPGLVGDQHRLSQIIVNLLSNAVKFTERGGVSLQASLEKRLLGRVKLKFTVRDTGIGIAQELIPRLFQPFTQADGSTTRRFGGTGLGLSISKQLVQMMGGEIWCESVAGQGSTFCFTAWFGAGQPGEPRHQPPEGSAERAFDEADPDFSGSRVLLVEDNPVNLELANEILHGTGALVDLAVNGREAVALITGGSARYDLVLMDLQMPVMDGYQACRLVRSDSRFTGLPIIAMTAHAMKEVQQSILEAGMSAIITKPINARTFLRVLRSFLGARGASGQPSAPPGVKGGGQGELRDRAGGGTGLRGPEPGSAATGASTAPERLDPSLVSPILGTLLDLIKGRNGKAERFLDSYQLELAGLPEPDLRQIKQLLKNFDFPAARAAILSLASHNDIQLSPDHAGGDRS